MKIFVLCTVLLVTAFTNVAAADNQFCGPDANGKPLCVLLHRGSTGTNAETEYYVARTWDEYKSLFKHLVKPTQFPPPTPEGDLRDPRLTGQGIDLQKLQTGKWVVMAIAIGTKNKDACRYALQKTEFTDSTRTSASAVFKITPALTGPLQPASDPVSIRGGSYFMFVTTKAFADQLQISAFTGVRTFQFESADDESQVFSFISVSQMLAR